MINFSHALVPFALPLGWGLGYMLTTGIEKIFDYFSDSDSALNGMDMEETDPAGKVSSPTESVRVPNDQATPAGVALSPSESSAPAGVVLSEEESKLVGDNASLADEELKTVYKLMKHDVKHYMDPEGDVDLLEQMFWAETMQMTEAPPDTEEDRDVSENLCKFSNNLTNSWVNAALQSVLNLSETKRCLAQEKIFLEASPIPSCSGLILSAIRNPGKHVSPEEIKPILEELTVRDLGKGGEFEVRSLVELVLVWLDSFGGKTDTELFSQGSCSTCQANCLELLSNGPVIELPTPRFEDNIQTLFRRWLTLGLKTICPGCGAELSYKHCLTNNNVLVFHLPQSARLGQRNKLTPNQSLTVQGEHGPEVYKLSSVICNGSDKSKFYTCIPHGAQVVKAIDDHVFTAAAVCSEDMNRRGFLYVYEKERKR